MLPTSQMGATDGDILFGLDFSPDALLERLGALASKKYVAPLLAEVRGALLSAVAGDPPADWGAALERNGLANLPAEAQARIWRAAIDAAASVREPRPAPALAVADVV